MMSLWNNESKKNKTKLIQLQNIVLDMDSNKLQVSEEFLEQMTKYYISRHLKVINGNLSSMNRITSISRLFKNYDTAIKNIDELIKIEDYYNFKKPVPSQYKVMLEDKLDRFLVSFITREWRKVYPRSLEEASSSVFKAKQNAFFASFEPYEERLTCNAILALEKFKNGAESEDTDQSGD